MNKYARKKKAKISESQCFLVRYRKTYVLNKLELILKKARILLIKNTTHMLESILSSKL